MCLALKALGESTTTVVSALQLGNSSQARGISLCHRQETFLSQWLALTKFGDLIFILIILALIIVAMELRETLKETRSKVLGLSPQG